VEKIKAEGTLEVGNKRGATQEISQQCTNDKYCLPILTREGKKMGKNEGGEQQATKKGKQATHG